MHSFKFFSSSFLFFFLLNNLIKYSDIYSPIAHDANSFLLTVFIV